jgi:hypothetical protein
MALVAPLRWLVVVTLLALAGCAGTATPNWHYPGSAEYQRRQAERFDPYPENDIAPPVEGGRPQGYQTPRAEVTRARQQLPQW